MTIWIKRKSRWIAWNRFSQFKINPKTSYSKTKLLQFLIQSSLILCLLKNKHYAKTTENREAGMTASDTVKRPNHELLIIKIWVTYWNVFKL